MKPSAQAFGFRIILVTLAVGCALGLVHSASVLTFHVPFDPNEGWNAYFAQMAIATGSPYPAEQGFLVNNYPPLSFFLIGGLTRIFGDAIVVGRVVSLLSLCVIAFGIAKTASKSGSSKEQSAFAGLLFIACLLLTSDYVGMDDPQLLGHAIAVWGMMVALRTPRTSRSMVISALLLAIAFFVKHNLVLLPLSLAAWMLLVDRRRAVTFIASGLIFVLIGIGAFRDAFATGFFHQIDSARVYALDNIRTTALGWLPWAALPISGALLLFWIGRRDQFAVFAAIYAAVATVGGLAFSGGAGVDANVLFDADIALALCASLLFDRLESRIWATVSAALYLIPLALLLCNSDQDWLSRMYWLEPMAEDRRIASQEIMLLRSKPDPAVCEMLSLCYWAGRSPQVDVFNMDQRYRTGAQSDADLIRLISEKKFSTIQLESLKPFPLPKSVERAVLLNYSVVQSDGDRVFLTPR